MAKKPQSDRDASISRAQYSYETIKNLILRNKLDFKKKLSDSQLSEVLGLSRTPIREALIMLETEGLITRDENRGFTIRLFSVKDIKDIFQFRELIECSCTKLVIENVDEAALNDLENIVKEVGLLAKQGNAPEAMARGLNLHIKFMQLSGNRMIAEAVGHCYDKLTLIGWSIQKPEIASASHEEHINIISALRARDEDRLRKAIREHIAAGRDRVMETVIREVDRLFFAP